MGANQLKNKWVKRLPILAGYADDHPTVHGRPPDTTARQVVETREPDPPIPGAPGSVHIAGRGWWPADRVIVGPPPEPRGRQPEPDFDEDDD